MWGLILDCVALLSCELATSKVPVSVAAAGPAGIAGLVAVVVVTAAFGASEDGGGPLVEGGENIFVSNASLDFFIQRLAFVLLCEGIFLQVRRAACMQLFAFLFKFQLGRRSTHMKEAMAYP